MYIKNKLKIENLVELEQFIITHKLYNDFISFKNINENETTGLGDLINSSKSYSKSSLLIKIRTLKIFTYPSKMQYMYWYIRGNDIITSKKIVSNLQSSNSKKRLNKYNKDEIRSQSKRCIEYWILRGYSMQAAEILISKLQSTFSLEKCILKHGEVKGLEIFEDRQKKWQTTLNNKSASEIERINKLKAEGGKSQLNIPKTDIHKESISKSKLKYYKTHSVYNKGKTYIELFGTTRATEIINKWNTPERSLKLREHRIREIKKSSGQIMPNYNKGSISVIEQYGKECGYSFKHAENGGEYHIKELGYFLDAYDVENNIVLEIDESYHFKKGELRKKDKIRQREIEELLKCKFIRIKI